MMVQPAANDFWFYTPKSYWSHLTLPLAPNVLRFSAASFEDRCLRDQENFTVLRFSKDVCSLLWNLPLLLVLPSRADLDSTLNVGAVETFREGFLCCFQKSKRNSVFLDFLNSKAAVQTSLFWNVRGRYQINRTWMNASCSSFTRLSLNPSTASF